MQAKLVGISLCVEAGKACYIPLGHSYPGVPEQLDREKTLAALKPVLENPQIGKIGQNIKYDTHIFLTEGIRLKGIQEDTMLQSYVLNSTASRHNMDALAQRYLGRETIHFEDIAGKGAKHKTFDQIELEKATDYAAEDADITFQLNQDLRPRFDGADRLYSVYRDIELPLVEVLVAIEQNGVLIDRERLHDQGNEIGEKLREIEQSIYDLADEEFNLSSPKQIQTILFEKLELPVIRKTNSLRAPSASLKASGVSGSITTWARPSRSRRSIKITPP